LRCPLTFSAISRIESLSPPELLVRILIVEAVRSGSPTLDAPRLRVAAAKAKHGASWIRDHPMRPKAVGEALRFVKHDIHETPFFLQIQPSRGEGSDIDSSRRRY